jgi:transcriptional regulator with XRE-family HTH domain
MDFSGCQKFLTMSTRLWGPCVDVKEIGRRIKERRLELGWSLRQLALKADDISHTQVADIEEGRIGEPGLSKLVRLYRALELPLESLVHADGYLAEEEEAPHGVEDPEIASVEVNLLAIKELNPDAVRYLAGLIKSVKEEEERKYLEDLRARRKSARKRPRAGDQADKEI